MLFFSVKCLAYLRPQHGIANNPEILFFVFTLWIIPIITHQLLLISRFTVVSL